MSDNKRQTGCVRRGHRLVTSGRIGENFALALLTALAVGLLAGPGVVHAQSAGTVRRVGVLGSWPECCGMDWSNPLPSALLQRMRDLGWKDGQNVVFEGRWGPQERLPDLAADLVNARVEVILAWSTPAVAALKRQTTSIPIVMAGVGNAVETGLVASLARPGGNVTGVTQQGRELLQKRIQLIRDVVPGTSRVGILWDSTIPVAVNVRAAVEDITKVMRVQFELVEAATPTDLDSVFAALRRARVAGVAIMPVARYLTQPREVASAALAHRVVTVFGDPESVTAGGLMAYYPDWVEMTRMAANYVDRILRGARPAELPVEQPTKFKLMINRKTAKLLGLRLPSSLLVSADQVIE